MSRDTRRPSTASHYGFGAAFTTVWKVLRWVFVVVFVFLAFALIGSYLDFYNNYSVVYGSLGAVIILMLWLYLTGVTILIGGEVNAIIEQAAVRTRDPEAKAPDVRLPGESARHARQERNNRKMLKYSVEQDTRLMPAQPFMISR